MVVWLVAAVEAARARAIRVRRKADICCKCNVDFDLRECSTWNIASVDAGFVAFCGEKSWWFCGGVVEGLWWFVVSGLDWPFIGCLGRRSIQSVDGLCATTAL